MSVFIKSAVLITFPFSFPALAKVSTDSHWITDTYSLQNTYYPGAAIRSYSGFSQEDAYVLSLKSHYTHTSGGETVLELRYGPCNYTNVRQGGTMGPSYCDILLRVKN